MSGHVFCNDTQKLTLQIERSIFALPPLSILGDCPSNRLWIPIPRMYGVRELHIPPVVTGADDFRDSF